MKHPPPPAASARERRFLERESQRWCDMALIAPETRDSLLALYPEKKTGPAQLETIAKVIGSVFLGMAVILFNAHNWSQFAPWTRLAIVTLALAGVGAFFLHRLKRGAEGAATAAATLMLFVFATGLFLVAQSFNLLTGSITPLIVFALIILPFAKLLRSTTLHIAVLTLAGVWTLMAAHKTESGVAPAIESTLWFFPVACAIGFAEAYRHGHLWMLRLTLMLVCGVGLGVLLTGMQYEESTWLVAGGLLGGAFALISACHEPADEMRQPWRTWAAWVGTGCFLVMGSVHFFGNNPSGYTHHEFPTPRDGCGALPVAPALILGGATLVALFAKVRRDGRLPWLALAVPPLALLCLAGFLGHPYVGFAAANLAHLALGFWLLRDGVSHGRTGGYALGVACLLAWGLARYVDFAENLGLLGAAGAMAAVGAALFVSAKLWRNIRTEKLELEPHAVRPTPALEALESKLVARRLPILGALSLLLLALIPAAGVKASLPLWTGERILMATVPVDPRDLFLGDYVILRFEANNQMSKHPIEDPENRRATDKSAPVYAVLEKDAEGVHRLKRLTTEKPTGGTFLKSTGAEYSHLTYGIERFHVKEDTGTGWEKLQRAKTLYAEIAVDADGSARVVRLTASPK